MIIIGTHTTSSDVTSPRVDGMDPVNWLFSNRLLKKKNKNVSLSDHFGFQGKLLLIYNIQMN